MSDKASPQPTMAADIPQGLALFLDHDNLGWIDPQHLKKILSFLSQRYAPTSFVTVLGNKFLSGQARSEFADMGCEVLVFRGTGSAWRNAMLQHLCSCLARLPRHIALISGRKALQKAVTEICQTGRKLVLLVDSKHIPNALVTAVEQNGGAVHVISRQGKRGFLIDHTVVKLEQDPPHILPPQPCEAWSASPSRERSAFTPVPVPPSDEARQGAPPPALTFSSAPDAATLSEASLHAAERHALPATPTNTLQNKPAAKTCLRGLAVLVDLENISWLRAAGLFQLVNYLATYYGTLSLVRVYANRVLANVFAQTMRGEPFQVVAVDTSRVIVDAFIHQDVANLLHQLPDKVAMLTGDADFAPTVQLIARSGRKPIVIASKGCANHSFCRTVINWGGDAYIIQPRPQSIAIVPVVTGPIAASQLHRAYPQDQGSPIGFTA